MKCAICNKQIRKPPYVMKSDLCTGDNNVYHCAVCADIKKSRRTKKC